MTRILTNYITTERLLEENEALRQIIREALPWVRDAGDVALASEATVDHDESAALLERMRAAIGEEKA